MYIVRSILCLEGLFMGTKSLLEHLLLKIHNIPSAFGSRRWYAFTVDENIIRDIKDLVQRVWQLYHCLIF